MHSQRRQRRTTALDDPLDRWSRRLIERLARELGGRALFPFGGPPFLPFQRWASQQNWFIPRRLAY